MLRLGLRAQLRRLEAIEHDERRIAVGDGGGERLLEGGELRLEENGAAQRADARAERVRLARRAGVDEGQVAREQLVEALEQGEAQADLVGRERPERGVCVARLLGERRNDRRPQVERVAVGRFVDERDEPLVELGAPSALENPQVELGRLVDARAAGERTRAGSCARSAERRSGWRARGLDM